MDKKMDKLIEKYVTSQNKMHTINGLMIAQLICQRRFLDAHGAESATEIVSSIMQDIANIMQEITDEK